MWWSTSTLFSLFSVSVLLRLPPARTPRQSPHCHRHTTAPPSSDSGVRDGASGSQRATRGQGARPRGAAVQVAWPRRAATPGGNGEQRNRKGGGTVASSSVTSTSGAGPWPTVAAVSKHRRGLQTPGGDGLVDGHPAPRRRDGRSRRWWTGVSSTESTSDREADRGGGVARRRLVARDEPTSVTTVGLSVVATKTSRFPRLPAPSLRAERHRPTSVRTGPLNTQLHPMRRAPARPARAVLRIAALTRPATESLSLRCRLRFGPCSHRFYGFDGTVDGPIDDGFRLLDA